MLRHVIACVCACGLLPWGMHAEPSTTMGPNARLIIAPRQLTSQTAFAIMGEVGEKMARVNATLGYQIGMRQRLKLSVDQLCQKLKYDFYNGSKEAWVQQIAGGASYKCFLDDCFFDSVDAGGWYSNAPSRRLSSFVLQEETTARLFERRIAGGEAWHAYLGTTVFPWSCASLSIAAVYDHVDYHKKTVKDKTVDGMGFSVDFSQRIFDGVDFNLRGDILQPYQHVGGALNWTVATCYGDVVTGIYGDYTHGRKGLPNNTIFGVQINLAFGDGGQLPSFYKDCCARDSSRPRQDLLEWIADPAVMMPIVLAIADQCTPPSAAALPDIFVDFGPYAINVSGAFMGGQCLGTKYSASGLPPDAFIDDNGVIFGTNLGLFSTPFNITVTTECVCGSASSSFVLTMETL
jgi:hypothetical protein